VAASVQSVAEEAADKAVRETFLLLGVDVSNPESVSEFRDDLRFGRTLRKRSEQGIDAFFKIVFLTIAGSIVTAFVKHFHLGGVS
jgi:hypothetical protein